MIEQDIRTELAAEIQRVQPDAIVYPHWVQGRTDEQWAALLTNPDSQIHCWTIEFNADQPISQGNTPEASGSLFTFQINHYLFFEPTAENANLFGANCALVRQALAKYKFTNRGIVNLGYATTNTRRETLNSQICRISEGAFRCSTWNLI